MTTPTDLYQDILSCRRCKLAERCNGPTPWSGPPQSSVLFLGEKPGKNEDVSKRPWSGPAGQELNKYLQSEAGFRREHFRVSNIVRCHTPNDNQITPDVLAECHNWTLKEVQECRPGVIVTLGAGALKQLTGDPTLTIDGERARPRPLLLELLDGGSWFGWLFPMANPAFGMRQTREMSRIASDFRKFRTWMDGGAIVPVDEFKGKETYAAWSFSMGELLSIMVEAGTVSMDTETTPDGKLWCATVSWSPGTGFLIWPGQVKTLGELWNLRVKDKALPGSLVDLPTITMHNSPFDLPVLAEAGFSPGVEYVGDTMVMAYLLGDQPQGLKDLAVQLCGMTMKDYQDTVKPYQEGLSITYFNKIVDAQFPKPEGSGQSVSSKAKRAITDYENGKIESLLKRWQGWRHVHHGGEGQPLIGTDVEAELGTFPISSMADVPLDEAIWYACRDADATERVRRILVGEIEKW